MYTYLTEMSGPSDKLHVSGSIRFLDDDPESNWANSDLCGIDSNEDGCQAVPT